MHTYFECNFNTTIILLISVSSIVFVAALLQDNKMIEILNYSNFLQTLFNSYIMKLTHPQSKQKNQVILRSEDIFLSYQSKHITGSVLVDEDGNIVYEHQKTLSKPTLAYNSREVADSSNPQNIRNSLYSIKEQFQQKEKNSVLVNPIVGAPAPHNTNIYLNVPIKKNIEQSDVNIILSDQSAKKIYQQSEIKIDNLDAIKEQKNAQNPIIAQNVKNQKERNSSNQKQLPNNLQLKYPQIVRSSKQTNDFNQSENAKKYSQYIKQKVNSKQNNPQVLINQKRKQQQYSPSKQINNLEVQANKQYKKEKFQDKSQGKKFNVQRQSERTLKLHDNFKQKDEAKVQKGCLDRLYQYLFQNARKQ